MYMGPGKQLKISVRCEKEGWGVKEGSEGGETHSFINFPILQLVGFRTFVNGRLK